MDGQMVVKEEEEEEEEDNVDKEPKLLSRHQCARTKGGGEREGAELSEECLLWRFQSPMSANQHPIAVQSISATGTLGKAPCTEQRRKDPNPTTGNPLDRQDPLGRRVECVRPRTPRLCDMGKERLERHSPALPFLTADPDPNRIVAFSILLLIPLKLQTGPVDTVPRP
ncbi:vegetative incompatibility protein HET-E-1 [Pseudozyma hubeiensis SY62]|uniref:Vegetative incompatibility protein HET-E-1 n=1 Tax=Pseudozyma hubeiensis (strain SY62) TaxID=1305764 RepID=R9PF89_PSEHS|nr:vegetative incompatibility protein HET-E-1 [Pseudozyma hubeiensis SY62]GAC99897.1 vegetative incompatibility protein HET-E-1 [Pseudozyma hubeiensis SY62]